MASIVHSRKLTLYSEFTELEFKPSTIAQISDQEKSILLTGCEVLYTHKTINNMDLENLKNENEYLKKELEHRSELEKIRMERIFQLVDELGEANERCSKLQDIIAEATDLVDDALSTDDGEMYGKLREIRDTLEG